MNTATVLCYNLSPERAARFRTVCMLRRIRLREVRPEEFFQPIGALAGILPPVDPPVLPPVPFSAEMQVLCGFSQALLDTFLQDVRKAGIPPVALKAVLTPTNASWNAPALHAELQREHAAMHPSN